MGCHSSKLDGFAHSAPPSKTKHQAVNDFLNYESSPHGDQIHGFFSIHQNRLHHRIKAPPGNHLGTTGTSINSLG